MTTNRLRRSALYLPAANTRAIEKAATLDCDVIIFDLEDAVSPEEKTEARQQACAAVSARHFGSRELVIRINGVGTPWYAEDLRCAIRAAPDAILLPKVEAPAQVQSVAQALQADRVAPATRLWCMLETPLGILSSALIAEAHPRLDCLVMGTSDLTKDLHARHTLTRVPLLMSLELCLLAARAQGKSILDGVCLDLSNDDVLRSACEQARELGFDGKTLIHPRQIAICNAAFSPTASEIEHARAIVAAYTVARAQGLGVAVLDGRLVEELHVREAERILNLEDAIQSGAAQSA
jgi:citrate lyase subunit beta/citryl-CoA lyase